MKIELCEKKEHLWFVFQELGFKYLLFSLGTQFAVPFSIYYFLLMTKFFSFDFYNKKVIGFCFVLSFFTFPIFFFLCARFLARHIVRDEKLCVEIKAMLKTKHRDLWRELQERGFVKSLVLFGVRSSLVASLGLAIVLRDSLMFDSASLVLFFALFVFIAVIGPFIRWQQIKHLAT